MPIDIDIEDKKELCIELAKSSSIANRERIWQLINEIGRIEVNRDKEFSNELISIAINQLGAIVRGERIY